ncbi:MAG: GTPase HflX, partial [Mailhella sp.]|nr:GTPase HflX [Mailhella sp.]
MSMIIVGDTSSIMIPQLPHARTGAGRLRGLRLLHTHLTPDGLSREDLMDLLFLRLDAVSVLTVDEFGQPERFQNAHLIPPAPGEDESGYTTGQIVPWDQVDIDFTVQAEQLEQEFGRVLDDAVRTGDEAGSIRAVLVSVSQEPRPIQERHLAELTELART